MEDQVPNKPKPAEEKLSWFEENMLYVIIAIGVFLLMMSQNGW